MKDGAGESTLRAGNTTVNMTTEERLLYKISVKSLKQPISTRRSALHVNS